MRRSSTACACRTSRASSGRRPITSSMPCRRTTTERFSRPICANVRSSYSKEEQMETLTRPRIQHLTGEVGAEVRDVDLTRLDDEAFELMRKALFERTMLVIRNEQP